VRVKENIIKYINGTTAKFYSINRITKHAERNQDKVLTVTFQLDSEYTVYEQYTLTEIDTSRRNLQKITSTNITEGSQSKLYL